jgi:hypothetical protein
MAQRDDESYVDSQHEHVSNLHSLNNNIYT